MREATVSNIADMTTSLRRFADELGDHNSAMDITRIGDRLIKIAICRDAIQEPR